MRLMLLVFCCFLIIASCGERRPLVLIDFAQQDRAGVYLNETLVFAFSEEIDPSSVHGNTVSIRNEDGTAAQGKWKVQGRELLFHPRLPMKADGSDAGLQPDQVYDVVFKGFPAYGALQSVDGNHLEKSCSLRFETVEGESFSSALFLDPKPGAAPDVVSINGTPVSAVDVDGLVVAAGTSLEIVFSEPLFPTSIAESDAEIHVRNVEGGMDPLETDVTYGKDPSQLLIRPSEGFRAGDYYKISSGKLVFYDFGGKQTSYKFLFLAIDCMAPGDKEPPFSPDQKEPDGMEPD